MSESPIELRGRGGGVVFQGTQVPGGGSIPYDPANVTGLALWLDALDANTINDGSPTDGDPVSSWADKSGNGYDAVQADGTKQPTWTTDALTFDGSQYLATTAAALFRAYSALTVAVVVTLGDTAHGYPFASYVDGAGPDDMSQDRRVVLTAAKNTDPPNPYAYLMIQVSQTDGGDLTGEYDFRIRSTADALAALVFAESADIPGCALTCALAPDLSHPDNTQTFTPRTAAIPDTATGVVSVGGDAYLGPFTGRIAAVLVWDRFLDATERRELNEYLSARYAAL